MSCTHHSLSPVITDPVFAHVHVCLTVCLSVGQIHVQDCKSVSKARSAGAVQSMLLGICTSPSPHARLVVDMPWCMQVLVSDPKELDKIREREFDITKERIEKILAAGANVILTTKGIDDMSLKYFVEAGAIACRRVPKEDLRYQQLSASVKVHFCHCADP